MNKKAKKLLAVLLSVLLVFSGVPFVSLASDTGTLTIKSEVTSEGIPAPTGTFQINFALDDAVPSGYEGAVFEIKSADGSVLTEGEDYTLEKSPYSLEDITKGAFKWGITIYTFSGLKAGEYTIRQLSTANGYKVDTEKEYSFTVSRRDGAVSGENFDTSAINNSVPCLYNTDRSIDLKIYKIKLFFFMNESFSLSFNVKDQNKEPVKDSQFMMVERDALISLVGQLASLGVNNIGNIDIGSIAGSLGGLDFSNFDAGTVLAVLEAVASMPVSHRAVTVKSAAKCSQLRLLLKLRATQKS